MASASSTATEEASCPICLEYLTDPVTLDCGHNFCRSCITKYCEEWEWTWQLECPICKAKFQKGNFRPNWQLANLVKRIKVLPLSPREEDLCLQHKEKLHLFCKEDSELMCFVCKQSRKHKGHTVVLKEEASQEYKDLLCGRSELLEKDRVQILKYKEETEKESQDLLKQTKAEMEKMKTEFEQLHQFLGEQEKLLMAQMAEVEKEIARKREEHLARLSKELSSLGGLIREMEEKQKQPPGELLQDVRSILQSCEKKETFQNSEVFIPELKWKMWEICDRNSFLAKMMKQLQATWLPGCQLQKENVTLDPKTANPYLILSEDRKSVRYEDRYQSLPENPERFDKDCYVLGHEGFTTGRHYWEVTVGSGENWAVGVARKSVQRKGIGLIPKEGIWAVGRRKIIFNFLRFFPWEERPNASSDRQSFFSLSEKLRRIRVSLNCEGGRVSFHDADRGSHLHTFSGASFSGETLLPFFCVRRTATLTISP